MLFERPEVGATAILISVTFEKSPSPDLDELVELSKTAGLLVVEAMKVFKERINPKSFIGKGKLEEIKQIAKRHEAGLLVINNELSPGQRNIETAIQCRVVTRTELILMILRIELLVMRVNCRWNLLNSNMPRLDWCEAGPIWTVKRGVGLEAQEKSKSSWTGGCLVIE